MLSALLISIINCEYINGRQNITLHTNLPSLAALIIHSDISIGACGVTTWERACLGLPSICITIADNQVSFAQALNADNLIRLLGSSSEVSIYDLQDALRSFTDVHTISSRLSRLTDGYGAERVAIALNIKPFTIETRKSINTDIYLFEHLTNSISSHLCLKSNDPDISSFTLSDEPGSFGLVLTALPERVPFGIMKLQSKTSSSVLNLDLILDHYIDSQSILPSIISLVFCNFSTFLENNILNSHPSYQHDLPTHISIDNETSLSLFSSVSALPASKITILSDRKSWLNLYLPKLINSLFARGHSVRCP